MNTGEARETAPGTRPAGAADQCAAAATVRQMFSEVAPRYDLLNDLLSFNIDHLWWRRCARTFAHILARPDARVLDLCCGTGSLSLALRKQGPAQIVGADFAHPMLTRAMRKFSGGMSAVEADALRLPVANGSFDLVVSSFGFRNLANYEGGLREIARVLKPGGEVGILDFGEPKGMFGALYGFYFRRVLPKIGTVISGVKGPYAYLPASVGKFPEPEEMLAMMRRAGFAEVSWTPYSFGIAGLFRGKRV